MLVRVELETPRGQLGQAQLHRELRDIMLLAVVVEPLLIREMAVTMVVALVVIEVQILVTVR
jgi:hypothetical protein